MALRLVDSFHDYSFVKEMSLYGPVFFMKHSISCPISAMVLKEYEVFSEDHPEIPCYLINVQENRVISDRLASDLNLIHETPQIIILMDNKAVWHDNDENISKFKLASVLSVIVGKDAEEEGKETSEALRLVFND